VKGKRLRIGHREQIKGNIKQYGAKIKNAFRR